MAPLNTFRNRVGKFLQKSDDVVLTEDYVEIDSASTKKRSQILVRTFRLENFDSLKEILSAVREGFTISIVNMQPMKDRDSIGLKRLIDKLKKTVEANNGDIAAFGDHWLIVTPGIARVYRGPQAEPEPDEPSTQTQTPQSY
tara:strand:+ start:39 stop:464 length:426 start_codon:yes stop_codon:yes gene_type:complete